jgi:uncharacterized repeat protein (TIGR03803 family)
MKSNRFGMALRTVSAAVTMILTVTLVLASSAAATEYKILHVFTWAEAPQGPLTMDAVGNLYGATSGGGSYGSGVVFKLAHNSGGTWTVSILHVFSGADGKNPNGGLILGRDGSLYGTTANGGDGDWGVVFKLKPNPDQTWTESVLHSFAVVDGAYPQAGLIFDARGNLYGTTKQGGTIWGTSWCNSNGLNGCGVVFKLVPNLDGTWTENVILSFGGGGGAYPVSSLVFDAAGNLYGTTLNGFIWTNQFCGDVGCGVVFQLVPQHDGTWSETFPIYRFTWGSDGAFPYAPVILDSAGNVYGTTNYGGSSNFGAVFKLIPDNPLGFWTEDTLYSFALRDGHYPRAGLISDAAGNLYGTTYAGGCPGKGVVFKLTLTSNGWSETVLHEFSGYGGNPDAGLIMDAAGNLYGTASTGSNTGGLVFEITP